MCVTPVTLDEKTPPGSPEPDPCVASLGGAYSAKSLTML